MAENGKMTIAQQMQSKVYIGKKTIKAFPMTKGEYCAYRGWDVPEDEDPNEEVYLVEYEADPKSERNHPDHKGYISMSPKHVFDEAYKPANDWYDRLIIEHAELKERYDALVLALSEDKVPKSEEDIFTIQATAMHTYLTVLEIRINKNPKTNLS